MDTSIELSTELTTAYIFAVPDLREQICAKRGVVKRGNG